VVGVLLEARAGIPDSGFLRYRTPLWARRASDTCHSVPRLAVVYSGAMDIPADLYVITQDDEAPEQGCVYVGEAATEAMANLANEGTSFKVRKWTWNDDTGDWEMP
jgi:hypothetical protein